MMGDRIAAMRNVFERIYEADSWEGGGSGEGSHPVHTRGYAKFLQKFLHDRQIKSVVDLGCGDWQFSRSLDWRGIEYRGIDLVPSVIDRNRERFGQPSISFQLFDGAFADLPAADLLISKDVLQHWSNATIQALLPQFSRYRFVLLTNCVNPHGPTANEDIPDGGFRPLDLLAAPFTLKATEVYRFSNHEPFWKRPFATPRWTKSVLLVG